MQDISNCCNADVRFFMNRASNCVVHLFQYHIDVKLYNLVANT